MYEAAMSNGISDKPEPSTLGELVTSINDQLRDGHELFERIDRLGDKIGGSQPRPAATKGSQPEPEDGPINLRLRRKLGQLDSILRMAHQALSRIEGQI